MYHLIYPYVVGMNMQKLRAGYDILLSVLNDITSGVPRCEARSSLVRKAERQNKSSRYQVVMSSVWSEVRESVGRPEYWQFYIAREFYSTLYIERRCKRSGLFGNIINSAENDTHSSLRLTKTEYIRDILLLASKWRSQEINIPSAAGLSKHLYASDVLRRTKTRKILFTSATFEYMRNHVEAQSTLYQTKTFNQDLWDRSIERW